MGMRKTMNVLLISAGIIEYDGRLRELIKVANVIGTTHYITRSADDKKIEEFHHVFKHDKKFSYWNFIQFCLKTANEIGNIDIVIADNRKAIIPTLLIKKKKRVRYAIQDARELYLIDEVKTIQGKIGCLIEKLFNNKFDIIISANKERSFIMKEYYGLSTEPLVFENIRRLEYEEGFDQSFFDEKYKNTFGSRKWRLVSTSGCSITRGILEIVETVGNLGSNYELYLIGEGERKDLEIINKIIKENQFKNIFILNTMGQNELKYFISHCDIGVVNYHQRDMNNKFCASGKIYEFLYEGLPVLTTTNPPLKNLCEAYNIGISTDDYTDGIKEIIDNYMNYKKHVNGFIEEFTTKENGANFAEKILIEVYANKLL